MYLRFQTAAAWLAITLCLLLLRPHHNHATTPSASSSMAPFKSQECNKYESCWSCLSAKDPYCGWCSLENKCSLRSDCSDAARDPLSWIPYKTGGCTSITSVMPKELQRTTARTLELAIDNLPPLTGQFLCVFTIFDKVLVTNATRNSFSVNCTTPRTDLLPSIPVGQHHFTAKLSVKTSSNPEFVDTNFTFFDCNTYTSCSSCVSSNFPCDWCIDAHRCTHDTAENCRNDVLITGVNRDGPSYRRGPTFCPTINPPTNSSAEILVADGTKKNIRVRLHLIGTFLSQTRFLCQFNIEGHITTVQAELISDILYCSMMEFTYSQRGPNMTATFTVLWGGSKPLDNPDNIHILMYKCEDMAEDCGTCVTLDKKFGCGWCQSTNKCVMNDHCSVNFKDWLDRNDTCSNLTILSFHPESGPWEGSTNILIKGINLGDSFEDIYGGISVAGMPCEPYRHFYKKSSEIICQVESPQISEFRHGPVLVRVNNFRAYSKQEYKFVDPQIESIFPKHGPKSGGTLLSIKGRYMNAGSLIEAYVDDLPCHIIRANVSALQCITSASNRLGKSKIKVKFDGGIRLFDKDLYEYVEDPVIKSLQSDCVGNYKYFGGIPAGGIKISISGTHLLSVRKPKFYLYGENISAQYFSNCYVRNDTSMACLSPYMPEFYSISNSEKPKELDYGFVMDNVPSVQSLSLNVNYPKFSLYPNPTFYNFSYVLGDDKSNYLVISGANMERVCQKFDITVAVGSSRCHVVVLSDQRLICKLSDQQLSANASTSDLREERVVVMIGQHFRVSIGKIKL